MATHRYKFFVLHTFYDVFSITIQNMFQFLIHWTVSVVVFTLVMVVGHTHVLWIEII